MPSFFITNIGNAGIYDPTSGALLASFTKMDSINLNIDSKLTEVYGGSGAYPLTNIMADRKPTVDLKGSEVNLGAYYRVLGASNTAAASGSPIQIPAIETYTITGTTVTMDHAISAVNTTITVNNVLDDTSFAKVASAPTQGQFSVATDVLTFNAADVGKTVLVAYDYDTTTGGNIQVAANSFPGVYTFKAVGKYLQNVNDPAKTMYDVAFVVKSCQLVGKLDIMMERQKASSTTLSLSILDPGPGYNPVEIRTTAVYA